MRSGLPLGAVSRSVVGIRPGSAGRAAPDEPRGEKAEEDHAEGGQAGVTGDRARGRQTFAFGGEAGPAGAGTTAARATDATRTAGAVRAATGATAADRAGVGEDDAIAADIE